MYKNKIEKIFFKNTIYLWRKYSKRNKNKYIKFKKIYFY